VATRRRQPARRPASRSGGRRQSGFSWPTISPDVTRSLVGIVLLAFGAITLIALILPGQGRLTDIWRDAIAPWFGSGRWLLPFLLLAAGAYVERVPRDAGSWQLTLAGVAISYVGVLGLLAFTGKDHGGNIGEWEMKTFGGLITRVGAFVLLAAIAISGLLLALDMSLPRLMGPLHRAVVGLFSGLGGDRDDSPPEPSRARPRPTGMVPVDDREDVVPRRAVPVPTPSEAPMSQTVVSGTRSSPGQLPLREPGRFSGATGGIGAALAVAEPDLLEADDAQRPFDKAWSLPSIELLSDRADLAAGRTDHATNIRIIEEKLQSFDIPAEVIATNTGPVVTQYEVRPRPHIKLSRIEALADDLAMALAARSIRIEAPIPGKDVVGIEIPNMKSEVVGFRRLIDETKMLDAESRLSFALGRDVSGKAYAVDLAKMPHLLIAGATGSGKSVCVNALITSLLMHSKPDEVRLILVDLKRVELGPYQKLPHLVTPVINEPREARAALNGAVREMEERYKALAAKSARNIAAYNALPNLPRGERLPYILIVVDELADLIMREGRKVEDPIVKIAQKARAVGIHLVLATQRPSVNVVTGLIKANVPSRIAFAMASMIDSRTVLDAPGAEDLIGRGDMLYQPVDLPRPIRLQGVFVSDDEVNRVTDDWRAQTDGETFYDESFLEFVDDEGNGTTQFGWLSQMADDDMVVQAAELVTSLQKASTSMLQTKLKVGFSRASRLMDELERYGVIGPQDPRNPAVPRIVFGPDNWLRSQADIDDPGD
jgi:S-DNA-T family DNA segregation ATPase FtsK/SpoIIIE